MGGRDRRPRLGKQRARVLHGPRAQRVPRRRRQPRDPGAARTLRGRRGGARVHVGAPQDAGTVRAGLRAVRGPDQDTARTGDLAGILAPRRGHSDGGLASLWRDRRDGEHRPRAVDRPRIDARPRLLGRRVPDRGLHAHRGRGVRRRLPRLRGGMGAGRRPLLRRREPLRDAHSRRHEGWTGLGVRPSVLHPPQCRGRGRLARQTGRDERLPADDARRLRPGLPLAGLRSHGDTALRMRSMKQAAAALAMLSIAAFAPGAAPAAGAAGGIVMVYVGTYTGGTSASKGIYRLRLDLATGALTETGPPTETVSPSFLALHPGGRYLYAVNETGGSAKDAGGVSAFAIDARTGALTPLNQQSSRRASPRQPALDSKGRYGLVPNYWGGSVA